MYTHGVPIGLLLCKLFSSKFFFAKANILVKGSTNIKMKPAEMLRYKDDMHCNKMCSVFSRHIYQICRSYCQRVRNGPCQTVWNNFQRLVVLQRIKLPDCDMLPEAIGGTSPECFIPFNSTYLRDDPSVLSTSKNLSRTVP